MSKTVLDIKRLDLSLFETNWNLSFYSSMEVFRGITAMHLASAANQLRAMDFLGEAKEFLSFWGSDRGLKVATSGFLIALEMLWDDFGHFFRGS